MNRVAIVCKPHKEELARILPDLIAWLRTRGYEPLVDREGGAYCHGASVIDRGEMPRLSPELVIVLGGDGTLLSVARIFAATGTQRKSWLPGISHGNSAGRSLHDS
jgi:NAD+ kinase